MQLKLGDVFEITTTAGLAYAQYIHRHKLYGNLVRVLPVRLTARPSDISTVVLLKDRLQLFVYLPVLVSKGHLVMVGNADIPEFAKAFPLFRFRQEGVGPADWFLWDGENYQRLGRDLPAEHKDRPNLMAIGAEYFIDIVERNASNSDMPEVCITG